jgi:hypothetical protein
MLIEDGKGTGSVAGVSGDNRFFTSTFSTSRLEASTIQATGWAAEPGLVTLTGTAESGIIYIKNNDPVNYLVLSKWIFSLGKSTGGTGTNMVVKFYSNPTGGTLISTATAGTFYPKNFGSSAPPAATMFVGANGLTVTGGNVIENRIFSDYSHNELDIAVAIPTGASFAMTVTAGTGNTSMIVASPFLVYNVNPNNV